MTKLSTAIFRSAINRSGRLLSRVVIGGAFRTNRVLKALNSVERTGLDKKALKAYESALNKAAVKAMSSETSNVVGRELQRLTTATLTTFEYKDKDGHFHFGINKKMRDPIGIK